MKETRHLDPEAVEVLLTLLGCKGFQASRATVAAQRAAVHSGRRVICGRCGQQGHTREECDR